MKLSLTATVLVMASPVFFLPTIFHARSAKEQTPVALILEKRVADHPGAHLNHSERSSGDAPLTGGPGSGHNSRQMISTVLALFMAHPGLAHLYGGLVRPENVLLLLAMCPAVTGLVSILRWPVATASLFSGSNPLIGDLSNALFEK